MSEEIQTYLALGSGSEETDNGFYTALSYIRENANTQYGKGKLFERLIRTYLLEDPFYQKRFSEVYLWTEWAENQPGFGRRDLGIDLVASEACQSTVPEAITCALESDSFEDAVRNAISLGGDPDTLAAIAGAIVEVMHGIPETLQEHAVPRYFTDASDMLEIIQELYAFV